MRPPYRLHYAPDNASLVIRLTLEEHGLPYETALVDRATRGHKAPGYLQLNPNGLIPVLETPEGALFETAAILLWLGDRHGHGPAPQDADRGAYLKWLFFASNTLHADMRMTFYPSLYIGEDADAQATLVRHIQTRLATHLGHLDALAAARPRWLDPDAPTGLCWYLACMMRWMAIYPSAHDRSWFRLADTPALAELLAALETRPATCNADIAEGLGPTPFTAPRLATPPEGSAT
ncbi:glutathione S-transferase family protein [Seohaeicola zhoushanensis]|uniref:GST N-terminal domain-containing protein n=1 Tax=Seohaeicola zhoushanensis TaxID=1569283 RepID=A0A8J3H0S7_9RHOB|nr:glutathione S-transferase family protein [Seohaeicola zhoushanensis]GHF61353.1 hypothetical protein GCM10017056_35990 [Seohaeicola zhoushanensis]